MFSALFKNKGPIVPRLPSLKGNPVYESVVGENVLRMVMPPHNPFYVNIDKETDWHSVVNFVGVYDDSLDNVDKDTTAYNIAQRIICRRYWLHVRNFFGARVGQVAFTLLSCSVASKEKTLNFFDAKDFQDFIVSELKRTSTQSIQRGVALYQAPLNWRWMDGWGLPVVQFNIASKRDRHFDYSYYMAVNSNQYLKFIFSIEDGKEKYFEASIDRAPIFKFINELMSTVNIELSPAAKEKRRQAPAYNPQELPVQPPLHFTTPEQDRFAAREAFYHSITDLHTRIPYNHPLASKLSDLQDFLQMDYNHGPEDDGNYYVPEEIPLNFPPDLDALYQEYKNKPRQPNYRNMKD